MRIDTTMPIGMKGSMARQGVMAGFEQSCSKHLNSLVCALAYRRGVRPIPQSIIPNARLGDKLREAPMTHADYRIESLHCIVGPLLPDSGLSVYLVSDGSMAVVMAAKCVTIPGGEEIRVVHIPTGEVIFRKSTAPSLSLGDDW